jgi:hypothetical protein
LTGSLFENVRNNQVDAEQFNIIVKTHFALPCNTHNGYLKLLCTVTHEVPELGLQEQMEEQEKLPHFPSKWSP